MIKLLFYQGSRLFFIMRITVANIILLGMLITVGYAAPVSGQEMLERRVSINVRDKQVKEVLSEIETKAEVKFTYRPRLVKANRKVSISVSEAKVSQVLDLLFEAGIRYEVIEDQIVLMASEKISSNNEPVIIENLAKTVSGKISDDNGPLPGVNIIEKGTTNGTTTDAEGNYVIEVANDNATLVFSFIGYASQEVVVGTQTTIDIKMQPDVKTLEEVVVVGYGEQKKSVVTGAISKVGAESLEKIPNGRIETALQGRVAGVSIAQNSGQPGSTSTVRLRGVTTFSGAGSDPLWVVDGVVIPSGTNMGYLNQSDIESIEILKDATSAAIYGTRAATGVILVTTKKGKAGNVTVTYNGFTGSSAPARKLDLLNAEQYASIINERYVNGGGSIRFPNPSSYGQGTNWQDVIFNDHAFRTNHQLSVSGGGEKSTFYISAGYQNTEGIVTSKISNFEQYNFRINTSYKLSKVFTLSQTLGYSHSKFKGLDNVNNEFGGPLSSAINLDPITPIIETDPAKLSNVSHYPPLSVRDENGNVYGIPLGMQELANPLGFVQTQLGRYSWQNNIIGNISLEASIIEGLKVKSTAAGGMKFYGDQRFTPAHYLGSSGGINVTINGLSRNLHERYNWNTENIITYSKTIDRHSFSVLLGQGAYVDNIGSGNLFTFRGLPVNNYRDASFGYLQSSSVIEASAYDTKGNIGQNNTYGNWHVLTSLFARVNYNYDEKYLFTGIIRRDGSSRFGRNNKYGTFTGASLGWNVAKESFWPENNVVGYLKLRAGVGSTGNDQIGDYGYISLVSAGNNYTIGSEVITGYSPLSLENPDLKWEETKQSNIGFETSLFGDFDITFDYFQKKTTGILRSVTIPGYVGTDRNPFGNVADMKNSGIEIEMKYRRTLGPVKFTGSANFATLKNEVTYVAADVNYIAGFAGFQGMGAVTRIQVGKSYNGFFGYKTNGIFQNQAEIDAYTNAEGNLIQPNAKPGDFKWVDINGDGKITGDDNDKTFLGTSIPKYTFGATLNFEFKGIDLLVFMNGAGGNKIFQGLRRLDITEANYSTKVLSRWTGEGTSNNYPRLTNNDVNNNFNRMSNFYLENGDYLRFKVVTLGYTLPKNIVSDKLGINKFRVYVTTENLLTFTKYTGYDPEIGGTVFGIDKNQYPQARSFLLGVQIQL